MGCGFSKGADGAIVVSSIGNSRTVRRTETLRLVEELRSLGVASGPPPCLILDESRLHPVSVAVAEEPELKEAISKNPDLHSFLNDHINNAIITPLRCLAGVKGHLDEARVMSSAVGAALECWEKENDKKKKTKKKKSNNNYLDLVEKLKKSMAMGDPFAKLNIEEIRDACFRQQSLLAMLRRRNQELEKRLRSVKKWRKLWNVIYTLGFVAFLACSVVLAGVGLPIVGVTAATACATFMKSVEPVINSVWDKGEGSLQGVRDVIAAMQRRGELVGHELENVRSSVWKLKIDMTAMLEGVNFAISGEEDWEEMAVKFGIENIMAKKGDVDKGIDTLKEKLNSFEGEIKRAATQILEIVMKVI